ncbi:Alkanesulfonate monooxygenase [archaeon HR01]|nr:Alkanesulfonate monooxygenase [archaeon HR01]
MDSSFSYGVGLQTYTGGMWDGVKPTLEELGAYVRRAEELGYTTIWHTDRLLPTVPPGYSTAWYEPLTTLSSIIPYIKKAGVGTSAVVLPLRNPVILAKQLATMDVLSGGRLKVGIAMGWSQQEYAATGTDFKRRSAIYSEYIRVLSMLLTGEKVSFQGRYVSISDVEIRPHPVQRPRPPIYMGGGGPWVGVDDTMREKLELRVFSRIAEMADGWIAGARIDASTAQRYIQLLRKLISERGRDPAKFTILNQNFVYVYGVSGSQEELKSKINKIVPTPFDAATKVWIVGEKQDVAARIDKMVNAGVQHFIVWPVGNHLPTIEYLAEEIFPKYVK